MDIPETLKRLYTRSVSKGRKSGKQSLHSWQVVADRLDFNAGYIYSVAQGKRRPSPKLRAALKRDFEFNCQIYDEWKAANAEKINAIVAWAENMT